MADLKQLQLNKYLYRSKFSIEEEEALNKSFRNFVQLQDIFPENIIPGNITSNIDFTGGTINFDGDTVNFSGGTITFDSNTTVNLNGTTTITSIASSPWVNSGTTTSLDTTTDDVVIGAASPVSSAKFSIDGDADQIQLLVQGNSTQSSSPFVIEQSDGTNIFEISNGGVGVLVGSDTSFSIRRQTSNGSATVLELRNIRTGTVIVNTMRTRIDFDVQASSGSDRIDGLIDYVVIDSTSGAEDGEFEIEATVAGSQVTVAKIGDTIDFTGATEMHTKDILVGTTTSATGTIGKVIVFGDNTAAPTMGTNTAGIYGDDVSGTVEMFAIDEADNATQLSPHNPVTGEWYFHSVNKKTGKVTIVHLERFFRFINKITKLFGFKLIEEYYQ